MNSVYRFRKERHFAKPPEAIWPFVADSARINEMVGFPPYPGRGTPRRRRPGSPHRQRQAWSAAAQLGRDF
jgi:hypothetical protein